VRTIAFLRALDAQLRLRGGRLDASVDPSARIDGPIELRLLDHGDGPWELALELAPGASLGRGLGIQLSRGRSTIRVGPDARVASGVRFSMAGGEIEIGARSGVREYSALHVFGRLDVGPEVLIGFGCQVHCADRIELHEHCGLAHAVTVWTTTTPSTAATGGGRFSPSPWTPWWSARTPS
jgi:acetyltransferase-like isoleucine patch superfamily enzyme